MLTNTRIRLIAAGWIVFQAVLLTEVFVRLVSPSQ